ncbi:ATP-dependent DNA helicase PIF1-like [Helianthus annuus]|uniref:ATP-dependent DNA helicase PIF1-like n=1 Tax=Helianthus annuus TaxID=4232 RepID=UPI0016532642|nr:ATP-dependent DNA helicase PIF1-like [Helianthus annuus]
MMHVDNDLPGVFFIDGPGGTGKTFLYIALLAEIRSRGLIALATASSGAAANNMPGGRTAHSRFKIPLNLENNSMCNIKKQSGAAKLIRSAKIIIWDEASMAKRQAIEAVDRTFQDIIGVSLPFGGKIMVMGGDFRQVLPVIKRGTRAQIVDSSVRMSPLWSLTKKMRLTINMRALKDPWFSKFLLRVGDGTEEQIEGNYIRIPDDMTIQCNNKENAIKELIHAIFPSIEDNVYSSDYIISRAILSTKNDSVDEINNQMIEIFQGEEKVYYSFDEAEDDQRNFYPVEFLNSLNLVNMPEKEFFLPRIPLTLSEDDMFPFKLKRKQFPIRLSFSMTINKAQGQTIPNVGIYLPDSVFSHGQLYVALSRGISRQSTKVLTDDEEPTLIISAVQKVVQTVMEDEGCSSEPKRRKYIVRDRVNTHELLVMFVKSFTRRTTLDEKGRKFNGAQMAARKDVKLAFGVLQSRRKILKVPCRIMEKQRIRNMVYACVILHNMILEDGNAQFESNMRRRVNQASYN